MESSIEFLKSRIDILDSTLSAILSKGNILFESILSQLLLYIFEVFYIL